MGRLWGCGVAGWLALAASVALGGTARQAPVTTTQRAVISAQAFAPDDEVMKSPKAASTLSATMVSATFDKTPAMQAFDQLAKQTGYRIELYQGGGQSRFGNVTTTINNQPFWAAMREICTRGNVSLYYYGDQEVDRIAIMPSNYGNQSGMKAAASIKGPFMTVVGNIMRVNTVQMGEPETVKRNVQVQIYTFAEPKAIPTQYAYEPVIDEAVDDNGNSMVPPPRDENRRMNMQSGQGVVLRGHFSLPYPTSNPGKRIARLRGHIDATMQLASEVIEIDNPLEAGEVSKTVGGRTITFKSLKKEENGQYTLELVYSRGDEDQQTFHQLFNVQPKMQLVDAEGGRYRFHNRGGRGGDKEITRTFGFSRQNAGGRSAASAEAPALTKLTIDVPSETQSVAIPFELVDLPLP